MFLADGANPVMSYVLLGVLVLIIILGPIMMKSRNKKEAERMQSMVDSLKKGDKIITTAGVYGKVIGIEEKDGFKLVTIETGNEKNKSFLTMDVGAIYANLSATPVTPKQDGAKVEETAQNVTVNQEQKEEIDGQKDEQKETSQEEIIKEEPVKKANKKSK